MASVFKRKRTEPIPEGAKIVSKRGRRFARWTDSGGGTSTAPLSRDGTGIAKESRHWWIRFADASGVEQRVKATTDKATTEALARKIDKLVSCRMAGEQADPILAKEISEIAPHIHDLLLSLGLLSGVQVALRKPLMEHLNDFERFLLAKGNTAKHTGQVVFRTRRIIDGCGFTTWTEIQASRVQSFLADLRTGEKGLSIRTTNFHLKAFKEFCRWAVKDGRAHNSPVEHLNALNVNSDIRHDRSALDLNEVRRLLTATAKGPERFGMTGPERAVLYRVAVETGLRANELRTLTVSAFDLDSLTVTILAGYSKHREMDVLPLREDTACELRRFFADKLPGAKAFGGRYKRLTDRTSAMLQADLAATIEKDENGKVVREAVPFIDSAGRYRDFHSLRHTCGSWLAAAGVHPKLIQRIMRHKDINLTLSRYTHTFKGQESEAVEKLPDLSAQKDAATGTDGK